MHEHIILVLNIFAGYEWYFDILRQMQESELMFKRKTFSYFLVVIIHLKEGIWEIGTLFMISRNHLTLSWRRLISYRNQSIDFYMISASVMKGLRKGITICFCDFILNESHIRTPC